MSALSNTSVEQNSIATYR